MADLRQRYFPVQGLGLIEAGARSPRPPRACSSISQSKDWASLKPFQRAGIHFAHSPISQSKDWASLKRQRAAWIANLLAAISQSKDWASLKHVFREARNMASQDYFPVQGLGLIEAVRSVAKYPPYRSISQSKDWASLKRIAGGLPQQAHGLFPSPRTGPH